MLRHLIDALQNRAANSAERAMIVEQPRSPVGAHGESLDFEYELLGIRILANLSCVLSLAHRLHQQAEPLLQRSHDSVPHPPGPVIELQGRRGKKTAAGKHLFFR